MEQQGNKESATAEIELPTLPESSTSPGRTTRASELNEYVSVTHTFTAQVNKTMLNSQQTVHRYLRQGDKAGKAYTHCYTVAPAP